MVRPYNNTGRSASASAAGLRNRLRAVEKAEEELSSSSAGGRSRAERRAEARESQLPQDRRCPSCGEVKMESRRWVVSATGVVCRSCWKTAQESRPRS